MNTAKLTAEVENCWHCLWLVEQWQTEPLLILRWWSLADLYTASQVLALFHHMFTDLICFVCTTCVVSGMHWFHQSIQSSSVESGYFFSLKGLKRISRGSFFFLLSIHSKHAQWTSLAVWDTKCILPLTIMWAWNSLTWLLMKSSWSEISYLVILCK